MKGFYLSCGLDSKCVRRSNVSDASEKFSRLFWIIFTSLDGFEVKKYTIFLSQTSEYSEPYRSINFQKMTFSSFSWSVDKTVCPITTKQVPIDSPDVLEPVRG